MILGFNEFVQLGILRLLAIYLIFKLGNSMFESGYLLVFILYFFLQVEDLALELGDDGRWGVILWEGEHELIGRKNRILRVFLLLFFYYTAY